MTNLDSVLKNRDITLLTKVGFSKAMVFPVVMYGCESWTIKKAECQRIDAFELWCWRRLMSLLDCKIKPVNPKGNKPWKFTGRTDAEAEAPMLWPPDVKSWFTGKDPDAGKDLRWEEKGTTEDEIVGWHHQLNKHNREQALEMVKDREAWHAAVQGVTNIRTWLSDWTTIAEIQNKNLGVMLNFFLIQIKIGKSTSKIYLESHSVSFFQYYY